MIKKFIYSTETIWLYLKLFNLKYEHMKKFILIIIAVTFCLTGYSQKYEDVIYLTDGSIVKGKILENVPGQQVKIKSGSSTFLYQPDQIDRIEKELKFKEGGIESGIIGLAEVGYSIGFGEYAAHSLKFNAIGAYRFSPHFSAGIGTGLRYYYTSAYGLDKNPFLPALGDLRVNFSKNSFSPYVSLTGGYAFDIGNGFSPFGFLMNSSVGMSMRMSERLVLHAGVGYDLQSFIHSYQVVKFTEFPFYEIVNVEEPGLIHAISLNVGVSF